MFNLTPSIIELFCIFMADLSTEDIIITINQTSLMNSMCYSELLQYVSIFDHA